MRVFNAFALTLFVGLLCSSPVMAQQNPGADDARILTSSAMDQALVDHESAVDQYRTRLSELLSAPQVRDLAADRGIDIERVESVAEGLSDRDMVRLAPLVAGATEAMQNGLGTITISVAAVIIILLILILVT